MPKLTYAHCRCCGRHRSECGTLSHTRLCADCGPLLQERNALSLHVKSGEAFLDWRRRVAASVGGVLVDDLPKGA